MPRVSRISVFHFRVPLVLVVIPTGATGHFLARRFFCVPDREVQRSQQHTESYSPNVQPRRKHPRILQIFVRHITHLHLAPIFCPPKVRDIPVHTFFLAVKLKIQPALRSRAERSREGEGVSP
jgi:hypothetical protein